MSYPDAGSFFTPSVGANSHFCYSSNFLNPFLNEFNVVKSFNVVDIQDVDLFLFASQHENNAVNALIGAGISQIAQNNDNVVIYVEGISKSGELVVDKSFLLQYLNIDPAFHHKVHFYSWDLKNEAGHSLFTDNAEEEIDRLTDVLETLEDAYDEVESQLEEFFPELWDPKIQRSYTPKEQQELNYLLKAHGALIENKLSVANKLKEVTVNSKQIDAASFPYRTQSMISSLQDINLIKSQFAGKTASVFVAGCSHLCPEQGTGAYFDISPLYHELQNHRAMILSPKGITPQEDIKRMG